MIDLGKIADDTFSIKLKDGEILKFKPPTQEIFLKMTEIANLSKGGKTEDIEKNIKILNIFYGILFEIFNENYNNKKFETNEIKSMITVEIGMLIIGEFLKHSFKRLGESFCLTYPATTATTGSI